MPLRAHIETRAGMLFRMACGAAILAIALVLGGRLAHGAESWEILLKHQLLDQQRCELALIMFVREVPVGNIVGLEGRARCSDTREFDFKRDHANDRFTLRLCEPTAVC